LRGIQVVRARDWYRQGLQLRDDFHAAVHELLAADVFPVEVTHAITRAERQGRITTAQGAIFLRDLLRNPPQLHSSYVLLPRAYDISSQFRIGAYDCLYVALAEREGCELVTSDDKLIKNLQSQFPFIISLASLP
jgi:predicted nucleic acid-binding protein